MLESRIVADRHLKLRLRAASGETVNAIAFRYVDDEATLPRAQTRVDLVYRVALDDYGGAQNLQLVSEWLVPATERT